MTQETLTRGTRINANGGINNGTIVRHYDGSTYEINLWSGSHNVGMIACSDFTVCTPEQLKIHKSA